MAPVLGGAPDGRESGLSCRARGPRLLGLHALGVRACRTSVPLPTMRGHVPGSWVRCRTLDAAVALGGGTCTESTLLRAPRCVSYVGDARISRRTASMASRS